MADMDARLIVQVVINIVNNAIKYTGRLLHPRVSRNARCGVQEFADLDDGHSGGFGSQ